MNITIGKRPHVGHRLPSFDLLPECVSEDVILAEDGHDLVVLDDLEGPGHDEAEVVNALAGVVQQVARGAATVHSDVKVFKTHIYLWVMVKCIARARRQPSLASLKAGCSLKT